MQLEQHQTRTDRIPQETHVGKVSLVVSNLERSVEFYTGVIGLSLQNVATSEGTAILSARGSLVPLVELREDTQTRPLGRQARLGMYHFAVLLPTRKDLANFVSHLQAQGTEFGAADHLFSEATYLVDPDGLSVEVYADLPRDQWKYHNGGLLGAIDPLNFEALKELQDGSWNGAPTGTTIGHMHFYVNDLQRAAQFYQTGLGFDLMTRMPGALFISAGGYHHHVAVNTWAANAPRASQSDPRLQYWELVFPSESDIKTVSDRLSGLGFAASPGGEFTDPWGITVHLTSQQGI